MAREIFSRTVAVVVGRARLVGSGDSSDASDMFGSESGKYRMSSARKPGSESNLLDGRRLRLPAVGLLFDCTSAGADGTL